MRRIFYLMCFLALFGECQAASKRWIPYIPSASTCYDDLIFNRLAGTASTSGATSYATGSVTPMTNALVLVTVINSKASAPDTPTVSGNSLTYVQIDTVTFNTIASATERITLFRALGAVPTAGAVTADFAGATQTGCIISVVEFQDADTSGSNGSGAIVQHVTNSADTTTNPTITYTTPTLPGTNALFFAYGDSVNSSSDSTPPSGFTEIEELAYATPSTGGAFMYRLLAPATTAVTATASSRSWGCVGVEVKPATLTCGVMVADAFIDMNGQTDGTTLTTTILNNGTRGNVSSWSLTPATPTGFTVAASFQNRLNSVRVGPVAGTTYTTSNASHCLSLDTTHNFTYATFTPVAQSGGNLRHKASVGCFISIGVIGDTGNELYDLIRLEMGLSGELAVCQLTAGNGGTNYYLTIETNPSGATTHTGAVVVTTGTTYWVNICLDIDVLAAKMSVYNTSGSLLTGGAITGAAVVGSTGDYIGAIKIGNSEVGTSAGTTKFENIIINTSGVFPFGP